MTTFTTEDKIIAEKDGSLTVNVEGGTVKINEPVAWIEPDVIPLTHIIKAVVRREQDEQYSIPLYIHPVNPKYDPETGEPLIDGYPLFSGLPHPVKELTDEEIMEVATINLGHSMGLLNWMGFAKAILRKASEK
jgi:hypothetical protein